MSSEVPDDDVIRMGHGQPERLVDFQETGDAACRVDFKVDIQHPPLAAGEAQPLDALRDGDAEFHEEE